MVHRPCNRKCIEVGASHTCFYLIYELTGRLGLTTTSISKRTFSVWFFSILAAVFGVLTLKSGGSVLFIDGEARQAAGHYVPFVLWFNFLAGFVYLYTAASLWLMRSLAARLSIILFVATLFVFVIFGFYILNGGEYEMRTVMAMTLRSTVWLIIAVYCWNRFLRHQR
jgi:hypothetical protein